MTQEAKNEALEQIELDIKFGFENEQQLFDGLEDMFYDEDDIDDVCLKQTIHQKYEQHQKEVLQWAKPTGFDKLVKAFDQLIAQKIVCCD